MRTLDVMNAAVLVDETVKAEPRQLVEFKVRASRALIKRLPQPHCVLVGDSGERTPEAHVTVLSEFSSSVDAVYIRNVSGEDRGAARYQALFSNPAANAKLVVVAHPHDLPSSLQG